VNSPLSLCNELLAADGHDLGTQCRIAAEPGYTGLGIAPGTLGVSVAALLDRWLGGARIAHVQLDDSARGAPATAAIGTATIRAHEKHLS